MEMRTLMKKSGHYGIFKICSVIQQILFILSFVFQGVWWWISLMITLYTGMLCVLA